MRWPLAPGAADAAVGAPPSAAFKHDGCSLRHACVHMQAAAEAMLSAVQRTALAARQALERTDEAAAGCQSATNTTLSKQGAALKAFQDSFAASMARDQVA